MSIDQQSKWISPDEFQAERRRLLAEGARRDDPRYQGLMERQWEQNEALFERFGKRFIGSHAGQWIGISVDGDVVFGETAGEAAWAAEGRFGNGRYAVRKLADFPGHELRL